MAYHFKGTGFKQSTKQCILLSLHTTCTSQWWRHHVMLKKQSPSLCKYQKHTKRQWQYDKITKMNCEIKVFATVVVVLFNHPL